jgi:hypothetical protein
MNIEEFWKIIEKGKNSEEPEEIISEELKKLPANEIISYQEHFDTFFVQAYQWQLWGAAYIIGGGCSDDGFTDFRYGLISKGKDIFENALKDPESLASLGDEIEIDNEMFGYVAQEIYEEMNGSDLPRSEIDFSREPVGEEWDFDDEQENIKHLPKLTKLFW